MKDQEENIVDIDDWIYDKKEKSLARNQSKSTIASPTSRQYSESQVTMTWLHEAIEQGLPNPGFTFEQGELTSYYDKINDLGTGSFGTVGLYSRRGDGKKFAIKSIVIGVVKNRMLERELKIACTLNHPNIVTAHGIVEDRLAYHLIMDHCSGGDLMDFVNGNRVRRSSVMGRMSSFQSAKNDAPKVVASLFMQMLSGLDYLHQLNIAHRDVKPENYVVVDKQCDAADPVIKLIDFGTARVINGDQDLMKTVTGTWQYAAPEISTGKPYRKSCDIWSLGCTLFVVCTGTLPAFAQNAGAALRMSFRRSLDIEWDDKFWSKHDPRMKTITQEMLQMDPFARPSAEEILTDQQWLRKENFSASEDPVTSQKACCSVQ
eukprot:TRINITY_DN45370_c0_g1_i1.p1 TRINITY_DN45370_c0_g1~~TRINITY_DN45370_c0_g1_i1.p1  ORF type:complete len:414 (-),score=76.56 TRINITY_DN45370_c0_g1_i1:133-1257(-)